MKLEERFRLLVLSSGLLFLGVGLMFLTVPEASAQAIKMVAGESGNNPGASLHFLAQKEKFFTKYGLDVKIIPTTSPNAVQAMLGGSMQILTSAPGAPFITATLEGAPPFILTSSWGNGIYYTIASRKEITKPQDLKGKTGQVGATFGSIPDVALRFYLSRIGMDPEKDVKLVQMSRVDWANVIAQLEGGQVQFTLLPPPFDRLGEKHGLRLLVPLYSLRIPWQMNGEWVLKSYLQSNRDAVLRFTRAIADAIGFYYHQKEKTLDYLTEFTGITDRQDLEYAYDVFAKYSERVPIPRVESVRNTIEAIKRTTPKAASADPAAFMDASLVEQLIQEGYFK